jgi:hypothetical protein
MPRQEISLRIIKVLEVAEISTNQGSEVDLLLFPRRTILRKATEISSEETFLISREIFKRPRTMMVARGLVNIMMIVIMMIMTDIPDILIHLMITNVNVNVNEITIAIVTVIATEIVIVTVITITIETVKNPESDQVQRILQRLMILSQN